MTVEAFMRAALYDPVGGYYTVRIPAVGGERADFGTAATIAPLLGKAIAGWIRETSAKTNIRHVIEIGGGSGALAESILKASGWLGRRKLTYGIVDISKPLIQAQQKRLRKFSMMSWFGSMPEALDAVGGEAIIISNELFDAFPCRRLSWNENRWLETELVKSTEGEWNEKPGNKEIQGIDCVALGAWGKPPKNGHLIEIQPAILEWLKTWQGQCTRGVMLSIDYGALFPEVNRPPAGTLRAYFHHQRLTGDAVFRNPGRQDMTVDVNFSDLIRWGDQLGWKMLSYESQAAFLARFSNKTDEEAYQYLTNENGMGGAFKALVQALGEFEQEETKETES